MHNIETLKKELNNEILDKVYKISPIVKLSAKIKKDTMYTEKFIVIMIIDPEEDIDKYIEEHIEDIASKFAYKIDKKIITYIAKYAKEILPENVLRCLSDNKDEKAIISEVGKYKHEEMYIEEDNFIHKSNAIYENDLGALLGNFNNITTILNSNIQYDILDQGIVNNHNLIEEDKLALRFKLNILYNTSNLESFKYI